MKKIIMIMGLCLVLSSAGWAQENWQTITDSDTAFQEGYVQVVGESEAGQSRYKAKRAAQVVAQRDLLEALQGLTLTGSTSVADGMLESDQIKTRVQGFLKGANKMRRENIIPIKSMPRCACALIFAAGVACTRQCCR